MSGPAGEASALPACPGLTEARLQHPPATAVHAACRCAWLPHAQGERHQHRLPVSGSRPIVRRSAPLSPALAVHTALMRPWVWISRDTLSRSHPPMWSQSRCQMEAGAACCRPLCWPGVFACPRVADQVPTWLLLSPPSEHLS